jgi:hypothetical protein
MLEFRFDANLPKKLSVDLNTYKHLLLEKYTTRYPQVLFYSLLLPNISAVNNIQYQDGKTVVDDLWGDIIPFELASGFVQPHTNNINPNELEVFSNPYKINMRIAYTPKQQKQLKHGQDWSHELNVYFLIPQFENFNLIIKQGDRFVWKDAIYEIVRHELKGRWGDTDYFLYWSVYSEPKQIGS